MPTRKVKLGDILPNPYRNIAQYPISRIKVEKLKESIEETDWWGNIVCRPAKGGKFEAAYGHHRLVAGRELLGDDALVDVIVRDLSDEQMLKIMTRENAEEYGHASDVDRETVRAWVTAIAAGKVTPQPPKKATNPSELRYAPSFILGSRLPHSAGDNGKEHPYTAATLAPLLGWCNDHTKRILQCLELIETGLIEEKFLEGLGSRAAYSVATEAGKAARQAKAEAKAKKRSEEQARSAAQETAMRIGRALSEKFKRREITPEQAAETALHVYRQGRAQSTPPPEINKKARFLAKRIRGILIEQTEPDWRMLVEMIKFREALQPSVLKEIREALAELSFRAAARAEAFSSSSTQLARWRK